MDTAMLHLLDESLTDFLRATVPLPARDVDISFEAPDRDWAARLSRSRPTVNLYLWDVRRNVEQRDLGEELVAGADGRARRRSPLPRVDCRYLLTAWTSEVRDEHSLLGAALSALLLHTEIDREHLKPPYDMVQPVPSIEVAASDGQDHADFWSALGGQLKPGLDVVVTATVDSALLVTAGPPVQRYVIRATADEAETDERLLVGGHAPNAPGTTVTSPRGAARVGAEGEFLVPAEPGDELSIDGVVVATVPEHGPADVPPSTS
jgi:hypothetical protein